MAEFEMEMKTVFKLRLLSSNSQVPLAFAIRTALLRLFCAGSLRISSHLMSLFCYQAGKYRPLGTVPRVHGPIAPDPNLGNAWVE
jgi:hypothetical protein